MDERRSKQNMERRQRAQQAREAELGSSSSESQQGPAPRRHCTHSSSSSSSSFNSSSFSQQPQAAPAAEEPPLESFSSGGSDHSSSIYTPRANDYPPPHFIISHRRMFNNFDILRQRHFENTRRIHFPTLETLGIYEQFIWLTERVGFTSNFWNIQTDCYEELTLEFLSSLELKENAEGWPYIKFHMRNELWRVGLDRLREWFGFHPTPQADTLCFRPGMDKDRFWLLLTGTVATNSNQFKGLTIPHPVLRCIQRILATSIFARGETVARANEEDLQLIDFMLRPDHEFERPDLMLFMVRHWIGIQQNRRLGGSIHIGAYVTLIAENLGVSLAGLRLCTGPTDMDVRAFQQATFLKIVRGTAGHSDRYFWRMPLGALHQMPIHAPISLYQESTWLYTGPAAAQEPPHTPPPIQPHVPDQFRASSSHAPPPPPPPPPVANPTFHDLYSLVYSQSTALHDVHTLVHSQGATLDDLQSRMTSLEDQLRAWWLDPSDD